MGKALAALFLFSTVTVAAMTGWISPVLSAETRYTCPVALPPVQVGGKERRVIGMMAFSNGTEDEFLYPDAEDKQTGDALVHMEGTGPPYGLWCQYDDRSELIINLPYTNTVTLCRYSRTGFSCK
jgi:hypothetical protein